MGTGTVRNMYSFIPPPKKKIEKLLHLVGFIVRIYHDVRSPERQNRACQFSCLAQSDRHCEAKSWESNLLQFVSPVSMKISVDRSVRVAVVPKFRSTLHLKHFNTF